MKKKIVIQMQLNCPKRKSKAMQTVCKACGVISVEVKEAKDEIEVTGEGLDPVKLMKLIRKKVYSCAKLVSVEEVKAKENPSKPSAGTVTQSITPFSCPPSILICHEPYPNCFIL